MTATALGHLLIVDDHVDFVVLLRELFEPLGYTIDTAETGRDAVARYVARRPDVVLLDLRLPDLSGADVFARMSHIDRTVPVIVITASEDVGGAKELRHRGAFDYVPKPCPLDYLERAVAAALATRFDLRRLA